MCIMSYLLRKFLLSHRICLFWILLFKLPVSFSNHKYQRQDKKSCSVLQSLQWSIWVQMGWSVNLTSKIQEVFTMSFQKANFPNISNFVKLRCFFIEEHGHLWYGRRALPHFEHIFQYTKVPQHLYEADVKSTYFFAQIASMFFP